MAYTPTVWVTGDVITAVKLNKAENGIKAAYPVVLSVTIDDNNTIHLGKSWDDLMDLSGVPVFAQLDISATNQYRYFLARLYVDSETYYADFVSIDAMKNPSTQEFSAATASAEMTIAIPE